MQAMFAGSGIPPAAAPSFRGVKKEKLHEVIRIEPSGQGISPEPCTTHGFGDGGTGRNRTGDLCVRLYSDSTTELLSHITAGHGSIPAGGLCLLSALDRLGESHSGIGRVCILEVGAGFEPAADTVLQTAALPLSYADHVPGFRRAEGKGKENHCPARSGLVHPQGCEPRRRRERGRETRPGRMRMQAGQAGFEPAPFRAMFSRSSAICATVPYEPPRRTTCGTAA